MCFIFKKSGDVILIDNTKKKSSIRLPSDEALTHCVDSVCVNYTSSLQVLQDEVNNKFAVKKNRSSVLGAVYSILDEPIRSQRVFECGSFLEFRVSESESNLQVANFCKDRLCPMCNWRRSLKIFGQVSQVMNQMDEYDFLFLTLTVRIVLHPICRILFKFFLMVGDICITKIKNLSQ